MDNNLKIYQLEISDNENEETEVDFVSLVDEPAIQKNFLMFRERKMFAVQNEDKRLVSGPAMIPNIPIYRSDEHGEYFVVFSETTIEKIAERFFKKGYQANINLMHERESVVTDSVFFESWMVDREKGKMPMKGFEDLPDGTWFLTARINNEETWAAIKAGEYRGFSVEGLFDYKRVADIDPAEVVINAIYDIIDSVTD